MQIMCNQIKNFNQIKIGRINRNINKGVWCNLDVMALIFKNLI